MIFYVLLLVVYLCYVLKRNKRKAILLEKFPGPKPHAIIGNLFNFFSTDLKEMNRREVEAFRTYGDTFRVETVKNYIVATIDPKVFEKVLGSSKHYLEKADDYKILKPLVGDGLIRSHGYHWQSHRKVIQPAFNAINTIKGFVEVFDQKAQIFVETLKERSDGQTMVDIEKAVGRLTGDILMETSMGIKSNDQVTNECAYIQANGILKNLCAKRVYSYWKRFNILYSTFAYREKRLFDENMRIARQFVIDVIENRLQYLLKQNSDPNNHDLKGDNGKGMCFVDILLQSTIDGQPLSNEYILDETHTFMIGGQDTAALTISLTLSYLSRDKHIQDKLYGEVKDVFGSDKNRPITYQQLLDLKYMEMVLRETMRMHAPVGFIGRHIDHDLELDDGRIIPAGVDIRLYLGLMMRSPKYYDNPDTFDPERFASNDTNQFTYTPFSTGKRDCVGKKFAMLSMKTVLTRVLQHYEVIEMGDKPIIQNELTCRSMNGFQMAFKQRED